MRGEGGKEGGGGGGAQEPAEALQCAVNWVKGRMRDIWKGFTWSEEAGVKSDTGTGLDTIPRLHCSCCDSFLLPSRSDLSV